MSDAYIPRLNDNGVRESQYYNGPYSPFYPDWIQNGEQWDEEAGRMVPNIGNCTSYAWARFWEIANFETDKRPGLCTLDANYWFNYPDGYERGDTPKLGAVLCLYGGNYSGWGHVAIVEQINDDGSILTSESGFHAYFWELRRRRLPFYEYDPYDGYIFQGFIYNPYAGDTPGGKVDAKKLFLLSGLKKRLKQWEYRRITNL